MASPGMNPHKKGEHVFNDIAGSLENCLTSALASQKVKSVALYQRFGPIRLTDLPKTTSALGSIQQDSVLVLARTIVAPATGIHNDPNSIIYSTAKLQLEYMLEDGAEMLGSLIWKRRPRSNSSFQEFNAIVASFQSFAEIRRKAETSVTRLIASAHDPEAEKQALAEKISATDLARRKAAIAGFKQHIPLLQQNAQTLLKTFWDEVESDLAHRIRQA